MTHFFVLRCFTLGVCLGCIALAGCGGTAQVPQLSSGGAAQTVPPGRQVFNRGKSWMSSWWLNQLHNPHHKKEKLLYLDAYGKRGHVIDVLDYRTGRLIGQVYAGLYGATNFCSDRNGNVYVALWDAGGFEFQRGTTKVIKTFETSGSPSGCAVSKSGDVAFSIWEVGHSGGGSVEVFPGGGSTGTVYPGPGYNDMPAAYDDKGNLFETCFGGPSSCNSGNPELWELPAGGSSWMPLRSNRPISWGPLEWDGKYLALLELEPIQMCRACIDQIAVSGNRYKLVNKLRLLDSSCSVELGSGWGENAKNPNGQTTSPATEIVAGNTAGCSPPAPILVWSYPAGGAPKRTISLRHDTPAGPATIVKI